MLSEIEQAEMLIALGRGDKYRLIHVRETLETGRELYISDKNFLHDLVKTHLKDRIYHARIVSTPDKPSRFCEECGSEVSPDEKFCTDCGTAVESSSPSTVDVPKPEAAQEVESGKQETPGGFTFTDDGDIGESATRKSAREKPKPQKKSRKQELEEYEKKYLNESETKVSWKAYDVKAKRKVEIQNPKVIKMKNGKWAIKGTSPITGIKVFRIVGSKKPDISGKKTSESTQSKKFESKKPNLFCEECGSKIATKDMFCTNCGAKR